LSLLVEKLPSKNLIDTGDELDEGSEKSDDNFNPDYGSDNTNDDSSEEEICDDNDDYSSEKVKGLFFNFYCCRFRDRK
jgi:hypothetical protein